MIHKNTETLKFFDFINRLYINGWKNKNEEARTYW